MRVQELYTPPREQAPIITTKEVSCDICGEKALRPNNFDHGGWTTEGYGEINITIEYKEGISFPEGGNSETKSWDCCPVCFEKHIAVLFNKPPFITEQSW